MSESIQVFDAAEIEAVRSGELPGTVYADKAVYADLDALTKWRAEHESQKGN